MAVDIPVIQEVVERACTRKDVLDACNRRDLSTVITALSAQGVTQGQLSVLTGIPQGRLSEYKNRKRTPTATSTFEAFADGLRMPPAARRALGLDPEAAGPDLGQITGKLAVPLTGIMAAASQCPLTGRWAEGSMALRLADRSHSIWRRPGAT
jgi:hypothetical protein